MAGVLRHDVHIQLRRKNRWETIVLRAGTEVPKHLAKHVTNPKAYVQNDVAESDTGENDSTDERDTLIVELRLRDLPTDGTVDELKQRIEEHDAELAAQGEAGAGQQEE